MWERACLNKRARGECTDARVSVIVVANGCTACYVISPLGTPRLRPTRRDWDSMATQITGTVDIHRNSAYTDIDADAVFNLFSASLFFLGNDALVDVKLAGSGTAINEGTASLVDLVVTDAVNFMNDGRVFQAGGDMTVASAAKSKICAARPGTSPTIAASPGPGGSAILERWRKPAERARA